MSATVPLMLAQVDVEQGGFEPKDSIEDDFAYRNNVANASVHIRMNFLRKVYGLLSIQLLVTFATGLFFCWEPVKLFVHRNDWMLMVAFISSIVTLIALFVKRRETPANFILLGVFTLIQAYTIGVLVSFYEQKCVIEALALTFLVVCGITLYTFNTKKDFSFAGSGLFAGLIILTLGGVLQVFIGSNGFELILGVGGALLFSLFIIFDTQQMMTTVSPEEYILATINLYLDIINLFVYILRILNAINRN